MSGRSPLSKPLRATLHFYKNYKTLEDMAYKNTGDIDNYIKAVLDALNEIVWADDRQIVEIHAYKHKSARERVEIEVEEAKIAENNAGTESLMHLLKSISRVRKKPLEEVLSELGEMLRKAG